MKALDRILELFEDDDPNEPFYDPVHIGGTLISTLTAIGCLYWLLWTSLVYEGGIFEKIFAAFQVVFTQKTLKDFGYEASPYAMGAFEGWLGNVCATLLCAIAAWALARLYREAAGRRGR